MNKQKTKRCKGNGKAFNFDTCNEIKPIFKYGLCFECYKSFLYNTTTGQEIIKNRCLSARKNAIKQNRIERAEQKESIMTKKEYEELLQKEVNYIVRQIDNHYGCISCDHGNNEQFTMQAHASHYYSRGARPELRYNFHNIHKSCSKCNNWESGNITGYNEGLKKRYGESYLLYINTELEKFEHLTREQIKNILHLIRKEKKKLPELMSYMGSIELRDHFNNIIKSSI